ncbi:dolichol phosphate-mannose biosynthesis regulatory protein Dpm2 [Trametes polyzona]|nr:dolichol phosphate-mannose biosynthesis regulatory protein Dpm2 [Trametes polyzona]
MLLSSAAGFIYYTIWTILLPILDESSPIHAWFPSREWALRIPALIVVTGISAIGLFLGLRIVLDERAERRRHLNRKKQ